jgi:hypothetical protein
VVTILGVLMSDGQFKQDPKRVAVVASLKFPRTIKKLKSFSRFCNFSCQLCNHYAETAYTLTACLRKGSRLEKNPHTLAAFEGLKRLMITSPAFATFDPECEPNC